MYTDIFEHKVVGDYFVPLLRCIHISGVDKEIVTIAHVQVSKIHISDIDIEIKTDETYKVPFKYSKVVAKLNFMPVRQRLGFKK